MLLAVVGLLFFHFTWYLQGNENGLWLPGLGIGIALVAWLGWWILPILTADLFVLVGLQWLGNRAAGMADANLIAFIRCLDVVLHTAQIAASWWLYHRVARGSRWLDDPRSATVFMLLVPGLIAASAAVLQASIWSLAVDGLPSFGVLVARFWLSRMVGVLVVTPFLIVAVTPLLLRFQLVTLELPPSFFGEREHTARSRAGDRVELAGLTFATCGLGLLLLWAHTHASVSTWALWAACLVLIVWTCVRQGLRGGCVAANVTSIVVLLTVQLLTTHEQILPLETAIQGNVLAFSASALLVGVSASWIRANETRYRHVVSRIPFVVYSARLPYGVPTLVKPDEKGPPRESRVDLHIGPAISKIANVMLVSPASRQIFGADPETLIGPFADWLERIEPDDRELLIASLTQLCLQRQPVTCEYRLRQAADGKPLRWVRDTLTPHYSEENVVDGWEGLIEDITDQRLMSHNLRQMTTMLQVLVSNLPTGVYFVQAPLGNPILVNARARHLLGQREDLAAGIAHLSRIYRLYRPDGTEYPADELPVAKALRLGVTCRANDIVVHRSDGRRIPLVTWAAPIDLHNSGKPDAAVWVLEDWTAMQQTEVALRESETRLRAVIETMAEGMIVQDADGVIIDCNSAAMAILGASRERLVQQPGLLVGLTCIKQDGSPYPREELPDQQALRNHQAARNVVVGLNRDGNETRWLLINSMPLPVGPSMGTNYARARVVSTFADITEQVKAKPV